MTRPRSQALVILALTPVVLALDALAWAVWAAWRALPWLLVLSVAGLLVWTLARHRRPLPPRPPKVIRSRAEEDELDRLRAEVEALRRRLAETTGQDATVVDLRTRLLRDARSGARPL
jgi:hypothetical protein